VRVLHVYKDYFPVVGGIENHVRALAEAQARAGHAVTVLVTAPSRRSDALALQGVRVVRAGRWATVASTPLSPALVGALRSERPDVTHLHSPYPVGEAAWLAFGRRPMVLTYHSDVVRQRVLGRLWAPGLRRVLRGASRVLATSPNYVESSPFLRAVRDRVDVVPLGVDPARVTGVDEPGARARLGPGPTLAFIGRLRYYKGLDVLIDALTRLPGVRLVVAGSGPMGADWRRRAEAVGVAGRIDWRGDVSDAEARDILAGCDLFVLPAVARSEAFGTVLLEAMCAGRPVVSTELGTGTSWVNRDGVTGRVVPPRDPDALAGAIAALLADEGARRRMGEAARARVLAEFTEARMVERVEVIYREVTE
jgi:glycosyltransferase involved in cell wall biosynthesis